MGTMTRSVIKAGVCGFITAVEAVSDDMQNVRFTIDSDCENIRKLAAVLPAVDAYAEVGAGFDGVILTTAHATLRGCCAGCIVPCGIFKAMQVAAGLALPAPVTIDIAVEKPSGGDSN